MKIVIIGFFCTSGGFIVGWVCRALLGIDYAIGYEDGWREHEPKDCMLIRLTHPRKSIRI